MNIKQQNFGRTLDGRNPHLFILSNDFMEVSLTNFGGIVSNLKTPDRNGNLTNIVLGFDSVEEYQSEQYLENCPYFGAIIGRVCNRISKGKFTLNGKQYSLPINDKDRHIHGGIEGFNEKIWTSKKME